MRFLYLLLVLICLTSYTVLAQSYSPLVNGNTSLFKNVYQVILALHVDSTKNEPEGLTNYFMKTFDVAEATMNCVSSSPNWTGPKMLTSGTDYYFFNKNGEAIKLSPSNELNSSWIFYTYANGDYVEATITLKEQVTFLGLTDSLKTISLQRKNASNVDINDQIDTMVLQISKNYGFLKAIPFFDFPSTTYPYLYYCNLVGMSNPAVGQQLPTSRKIYNFDIGDEFHYKKEYSNVPFYGDETKIIRKVIDKHISANTDTITYTYQDIRENTHYTYQQPTGTIVGPIAYTVSTYDQKYIVNDTIVYPNIYLSSDESGYGIPTSYSYSQPPAYGGKLMLTVDYMYNVYYHDNCWSQVIDGPAYYTTYLEGCGPNYFNGDVFPSSNDSTLVYYKKGSDTYGQPLILSNYSKSSNQALALYPNPLKQGEELSISTVHFNATQFTLYNSSGNKVFESLAEQTDQQIVHLPKLQSGLYVVQLLNDKNEYITGKLIIH